jgi:hypothetical protein
VAVEVHLDPGVKGGEMDRDHPASSTALPGSASGNRPTDGPAQSSDADCPHSRELAARVAGGTQVRLIWRQGTTRVWVEVGEAATAWVLRIQVPPERALDAFYHPYAYAGTRSCLSLAESLEDCEREPRLADETLHGQ